MVIYLTVALKSDSEPGNLNEKSKASTSNNVELKEEANDNHDDNCDVNLLGSWRDGAAGSSKPVLEASINESSLGSPPIETPTPRMSWADMAQEDELEEEEEEEEEEEDGDYEDNESNKRMVNINNSTGELRISTVLEKPKLSREQREYIRFMKVMRKKDFICLERFKGKIVNILEGLELHEGIFSAAEQKRIVNYIYMFQEKGKKGELKGQLNQLTCLACLFHTIALQLHFKFAFACLLLCNYMVCVMKFCEVYA